ncbi:hypothetical protein BQ8794_40396 [Mesorhizobium prunaredense]|uniref:Uncharacterized protein n=1 Tax=Mesorhizobium prunaredense TaxID=1631249 RepID=A0A1R3VD44_9HYPH|nr:hypothetical protein BQ8794_40396 [Mesorhizobium prunaredense]
MSQPHTPVSMWNRVFAPGMSEAVEARTVPRNRKAGLPEPAEGKSASDARTTGVRPAFDI